MTEGERTENERSGDGASHLSDEQLNLGGLKRAPERYRPGAGGSAARELRMAGGLGPRR